MYKSSYVLTELKKKHLEGKFGVAMDRCVRCGKPLEPDQEVTRVKDRFYHTRCYESLFFEPKG